MDITVDKIKELWKDPLSRRFMIAGVLVSVSLIYFSFIIVPGFVDLAKVARQASDLKNNIDITEDRIDRLGQMKERVQELKEELGGHSKHLPAEREMTELLEGFATTAQISDVNILAITPAPLKAVTKGSLSGKYYREMPIKITAKCGYHQLAHFISSLEKEKRIIVINDIEIQGDDKTPRVHNVTMMLKTYVSIDEKKK